MKPLRLIHAVINDLAGDQRLDRVCGSLRAAGYAPLLVGRLLPGSPPLPPRAYDTLRIPVHRVKGKGAYAEYTLRLLAALLRQPADLINANDLDTLPACWLAARLKGIPLVYDSHEYFTEVPELIGRPATRSIWLALERFLFPRLRHIYTVNEALACIYSEAYRVPVAAIRNLPLRRDDPPVAPRPPMLLYQGALNLGRGIELMIETMAQLPDYQLWVAGRGDLEQTLRQMAAASPAANRIHFLGFQPPEQLRALTAQARFGLSLEEDLGANYRVATPNKVYDYLQARTPVIVSSLPGMMEIVRTWEAGAVLEERRPARLAALVREMEREESYARYALSAERAAQALHWEAEVPHLLRIYRQALGQS